MEKESFRQMEQRKQRLISISICYRIPMVTDPFTDLVNLSFHPTSIY